MDEQVHIIFGRALLATIDAVIKVREGKMIIRDYNMEVVVNIYKAIQLPSNYEDLAMIFVVEKDEERVTWVYI